MALAILGFVSTWLNARIVSRFGQINGNGNFDDQAGTHFVCLCFPPAFTEDWLKAFFILCINMYVLCQRWHETDVLQCSVIQFAWPA